MLLFMGLESPGSLSVHQSALLTLEHGHLDCDDHGPRCQGLMAKSLPALQTPKKRWRLGSKEAVRASPRFKVMGLQAGQSKADSTNSRRITLRGWGTPPCGAPSFPFPLLPLCQCCQLSSLCKFKHERRKQSGKFHNAFLLQDSLDVTPKCFI